MSKVEEKEGGILWNHVKACNFSNSNNSRSGSGGGDAATKASPNGLKHHHVGQKRERDGDKKSSVDSKCGGENGEESDYELHIWTERERRKKMRSMFANLHALLPQLTSKADKSSVVEEAVSYIRRLQQTLQNLEKKKLHHLIINGPSAKSTATMESREAFMADHQGKKSNLNPTAIIRSQTAFAVPRLPVCFQTWISPNVVLNVAGEEAYISICSVKKVGFLSAMFFFLDKNKVEVVSAHISSDNYFRIMCMIHARVSGVSDRFPESLMIEEIYKSAVGEMISWLYA